MAATAPVVSNNGLSYEPRTVLQ